MSTSEKLQHELKQRKTELEKIETLDEKISVELGQLEDVLVRPHRHRTGMPCDLENLRKERLGPALLHAVLEL